MKACRCKPIALAGDVPAEAIRRRTVAGGTRAQPSDSRRSRAARFLLAVLTNGTAAITIINVQTYEARGALVATVPSDGALTVRIVEAA
jgi:hypothetical protein